MRSWKSVQLPNILEKKTSGKGSCPNVYHFFHFWPFVFEGKPPLCLVFCSQPEFAACKPHLPKVWADSFSSFDFLRARSRFTKSSGAANNPRGSFPKKWEWTNDGQNGPKTSNKLEMIISMYPTPLQPTPLGHSPLRDAASPLQPSLCATQLPSWSPRSCRPPGRTSISESKIFAPGGQIYIHIHIHISSTYTDTDTNMNWVLGSSNCFHHGLEPMCNKWNQLKQHDPTHVQLRCTKHLVTSFTSNHPS